MNCIGRRYSHFPGSCLFQSSDRPNWSIWLIFQKMLETSFFAGQAAEIIVLHHTKTP
jgi:hypothetical protein